MTAGMIGGTILFSADTVNRWVADAPNGGVTLKEKLSGISETLQGVRTASEEVEEMNEDEASEDVQEVVIRQPSLLSNAVSTVTSVATTIGGGTGSGHLPPVVRRHGLV